jgi:hypothetical protein
MNREFIPYEQALDLKELGFNEPCLAYFYTYDDENLLSYDLKILNDNLKTPLYRQCFRWFREKYGLYHSIGLDNSLENNVNCDYVIINHSQSISELETNFKSYEEAELECLKKLIKIVKNKK